MKSPDKAVEGTSRNRMIDGSTNRMMNGSPLSGDPIVGGSDRADGARKPGRPRKGSGE